MCDTFLFTTKIFLLLILILLLKRNQKSRVPLLMQGSPPPHTTLLQFPLLSSSSIYSQNSLFSCSHHFTISFIVNAMISFSFLALVFRFCPDYNYLLRFALTISTVHLHKSLLKCRFVPPIHL